MLLGQVVVEEIPEQVSHGGYRSTNIPKSCSELLRNAPSSAE